MRCEKHPNVETVVRCGRCDTPVCPKCSVYGPAGIRCRDCAYPKGSGLVDMPGGQMGVTLAVGLVAGCVVGYLLALISGIGFFSVFGGLLGGSAVGEALLRASGHRRGIQMEVAAAACTVVGAVVGLAGWWGVRGLGADLAEMLRYLALNFFYLAAVAAAVFGAVSRIRHL